MLRRDLFLFLIVADYLPIGYIFVGVKMYFIFVNEVKIICTVNNFW